MKTLLFLALFAIGNKALCQIDGVYIGNLVSLNNALVVSSLGGGVMGALHLNLDDKRIFFANYKDNLLTSQIKLVNEMPLNLFGELIGDSLITVELRTLDSISSLVYKADFRKVSSNPKFNLKKILKKRETQRDSVLIGEWKLLKRVNSTGSIINSEKYFVEYKKNGQYELKSSVLENMIKGKGYRLPLITWETIEGKLSLNGQDGGIAHIESYKVMGDTLITTNIENTKSYYLRK